MAKQEYIERNRQWLKDKAAEPGVIALDKGILYKVIKSGNAKGPKPNRNSVVVVITRVELSTARHLTAAARA